MYDLPQESGIGQQELNIVGGYFHQLIGNVFDFGMDS